MDHFKNTPFDVLLLIFSEFDATVLKQIAPVSKLFNKLASNNTIWRKLLLNKDYEQYSTDLKDDYRCNTILKPYFNELERMHDKRYGEYGIYDKTKLEIFFRKNDKLFKIPPEIAKVNYIVELDVDGYVSGFESSFSDDCYDSDVKIKKKIFVSPVIGSISSLKILTIRRFTINKLPIEIFNLANLETLNINCKVNLIQKEIKKLSNLKHLNILGINIKAFPKEICCLTKLETLYFYESDHSYDRKKIIEIPKEVGQLTNLVDLNLSGNNIKQLPKEVWQLTNLVDLNLSGNNIKQLPKEVWQLINLVNLNLSCNSINQLPEEIGQLTNLVNLNLSGNSINQLPDSIYKLTKLKTFNIWSCSIMTISKEIGQMVSLENLNLSCNYYCKLPKKVGKLTNLKTLDLHDCGLSKIPKEIGQLTNLEELNLSKNDLEKIPKEFKNLKSLTNLNIRNNNVTKFPAKIGNLNAVCSHYR